MNEIRLEILKLTYRKDLSVKENILIAKELEDYLAPVQDKAVIKIDPKISDKKSKKESNDIFD